MGGAVTFIYTRLNEPQNQQQRRPSLKPVAPFFSASKEKEVTSNIVPVGQASFEIAQKGFPSTTNIIYKQNYIISYDRERKQPHWVMERVVKEQVSVVDVAERSDKFFTETGLHEYFQSKNSDYYKSGYDRG